MQITFMLLLLKIKFVDMVWVYIDRSVGPTVLCSMLQKFDYYITFVICSTAGQACKNPAVSVLHKSKVMAS